MKILLLRHGETAGNLEKRYVGRRTDEGLCKEAASRIMAAVPEFRRQILKPGEKIDMIYASPMRRCLETAGLLFPESEFSDVPRLTVPGLEECDFGKFEYKNYRELNGDPDYQRFLDTLGASGFPGGETTEAFKERSVRAFANVLEREFSRKDKDRTAAFIVHGGTIMAVMERFAVPKKDYYSWQVPNLSGFLIEAEQKDAAGNGPAPVLKVVAGPLQIPFDRSEDI